MSLDYSRDALLEFLDYLGEKGIVNKNTAQSRKAACGKILGILDDNEAEDLRAIDINDVAARFNNLYGLKYTSKSLTVYRSRVSTALKHFFKYKENPANFSIDSVGSNPKIIKKPKRVVENSGGSEPERPSEKQVTFSQIETLNIPVALRPKCIIQLNGIPTDMTEAEAKKIANVVMAMANIE